MLLLDSFVGIHTTTDDGIIATTAGIGATYSSADDDGAPDE